MKHTRWILLVSSIALMAACTSRSKQTPLNAPSLEPTSVCTIQNATFTVDAEDLQGMLTDAGLNVTKFSMIGSGESNSCTPAYSGSVHFLSITLNAPDEKETTLGNQLTMLTVTVRDWLQVKPQWTFSHLDKYNIYLNLVINPGGHELSKSPADLLTIMDKGLPADAYWEEASQ